MKQILQHLSTGVTELADVPCPRVGTSQLLIRTTRSLISAGTERMLVEFGKAGWIEKARRSGLAPADGDSEEGTAGDCLIDSVWVTTQVDRLKVERPKTEGF